MWGFMEIFLLYSKNENKIFSDNWFHLNLTRGCGPVLTNPVIFRTYDVRHCINFNAWRQSFTKDVNTNIWNKCIPNKITREEHIKIQKLEFKQFCVEEYQSIVNLFNSVTPLRCTGIQLPSIYARNYLQMSLKRLAWISACSKIYPPSMYLTMIWTIAYTLRFCRYIVLRSNGKLHMYLKTCTRKYNCC